MNFFAGEYELSQSMHTFNVNLSVYSDDKNNNSFK